MNIGGMVMFVSFGGMFMTFGMCANVCLMGMCVRWVAMVVAMVVNKRRMIVEVRVLLINQQQRTADCQQRRDAK